MADEMCRKREVYAADMSIQAENCAAKIMCRPSLIRNISFYLCSSMILQQQMQSLVTHVHANAGSSAVCILLWELALSGV